MRVPAALIAIPLVSGAAVGLLEPGAVFLSGAAGAAVLACAAAAAACLQHDDAGYVGAVAAGAAAAGLALGMTAAAAAYRPPLLAWFAALPSGAGASPLELTGVLREDGALSPFGVVLLLDVSRAVPVAEPARALVGAAGRLGGVRLTVSGGLGRDVASGWRAGRAVRLTATLRLPTTYLDPGVPDERRSLARRGIVLVGGVKSAALVDVVSDGTWLDELEARARAWARAALDAGVAPWSPRSAGVAKAVLIGDRTGLSDEDTRRLQDAGTYHVIAISGGNIAVLAALVFGVLRSAGISGRAAAPPCALVIAAYGEVVVPGASVSRAVAAAVLYLAALTLDHRAAAMNLLAAAAVIGIAVAPVQVLDAGFLLSFGATLGILLLAPRLWHPPRRKGSRLLRRMGDHAATLGVATLAAESALVPLGALLFSRVTFWGLALNYAAVPLMTCVQAAGIAVLAASVAAPTLAAAAGLVVHGASEGILRSAGLAAVWPVLTRDVPSPPWWLLAAYYAAGAAALACPCWRVRRPALVAGGASLLAMLAAPGQGAATPGRLPGVRLAFLDVGQADATAIILPDGRALLVDAATGPPPPDDEGAATPPGFDAGARVVVPALRALGVARLEALVITHGDPDHLGGAASVTRMLRPRSIWEGVPVPPNPGLRDLATVAAQVGASWRTVQAGDAERFGDVVIRVLHPPPPEWERQRVRNEDSVVLEIRLGDVAIVLPGDIGREGEAMTAARLDPSPSRLVVLKAPHHGSLTSSSPAFLDAVRPAAVVFSAGRRSRYGHPAPTVVSRYGARGIPMFSTAEDGAVLLDTDGRSVVMRGWTGRERRW